MKILFHHAVGLRKGASPDPILGQTWRGRLFSHMPGDSRMRHLGVKSISRDGNSRSRACGVSIICSAARLLCYERKPGRNRPDSSPLVDLEYHRVARRCAVVIAVRHEPAGTSTTDSTTCSTGTHKATKKKKNQKWLLSCRRLLLRGCMGLCHHGWVSCGLSRGLSLASLGLSLGAGRATWLPINAPPPDCHD